MLTTSEIFKKYNFNTKKTFGQNFLLQENLLSKIVSFSDINSDSEILEVGAGLGSLTTAILIWVIAALGSMISIGLLKESILITIIIYIVLRFNFLKDV